MSCLWIVIVLKFEAHADPITILMLILWSRSGSGFKFYTCWKAIFSPFVHITASLFLSFCIIGVMILNVLDRNYKFSGRNVVQLYFWWKWIQIRRNDADLTGSGSRALGNSTLLCTACFFFYLQEAVRMPPKLAAIFFKMFCDVSRHAYK